MSMEGAALAGREVNTWVGWQPDILLALTP